MINMQVQLLEDLKDSICMLESIVQRAIMKMHERNEQLFYDIFENKLNLESSIERIETNS